MRSDYESLFGIGNAVGLRVSILFLALVFVRCFNVFHDAAHLSFFEDADRNRTGSHLADCQSARAFASLHSLR